MGSPDDFEEFFREDYGRLIAYLRKSGFEIAAAEDAAAEAMARLMEAWDDVDHARAWVRTAARRYAYHQLERGKRGVEEALWGGWARAGHHDGPESAVLRHEQVLFLLATLPDRQRDVMALVFEEYRNEDIATELKISEVTVRSNVRHARKRLKRIYEREFRDGRHDSAEQGGESGDEA